jgi:hypothetical protein
MVKAEIIGMMCFGRQGSLPRLTAGFIISERMAERIGCGCTSTSPTAPLRTNRLR